MGVTARLKFELAGAALALTFGAGYWLGKSHPQPAVALHEDTASQKASATQTATKDSKGREREVTRTFTPPARCGAAPVLASETVITRGPEVITQHATEQVAESAAAHVSLVVTSPVSLPGWSVGAGVSLPDRALRLEVGRRLFGNLWLTAGVVPVRQEIGIGLRMEW